jgi:predicted protein tyrosine phosphatase
VSGDLPSRRETALAQLAAWEDAGITDVIDVREERDDTVFIHANSDIQSHWFGVDDMGGVRDDAWFDDLVDTATEVLAAPDRRVLVHCHMGVNRGPSAAYSILLEQGWDDLDGLRAIRTARPVAAIIYAPDAVAWHSRRLGLGRAETRERVGEVKAWLRRNPLDLGWIISAIGNRTAA